MINHGLNAGRWCASLVFLFQWLINAALLTQKRSECRHGQKLDTPRCCRVSVNPWMLSLFQREKENKELFSATACCHDSRNSNCSVTRCVIWLALQRLEFNCRQYAAGELHVLWCLHLTVHIFSVRHRKILMDPRPLASISFSPVHDTCCLLLPSHRAMQFRFRLWRNLDCMGRLYRREQTGDNSVIVT